MDTSNLTIYNVDVILDAKIEQLFELVKACENRDPSIDKGELLLSLINDEIQEITFIKMVGIDNYKNEQQKASS